MSDDIGDDYAEKRLGFDLDDARVKRMQYDIAIGILTHKEIAHRYGFSNDWELRKYFEEHPGLIAATERMKVLFESERGADERTRAKALQATEELIPPVYHIAANPHVAPQQRIDAFKQLSRVGGLDVSAAMLAAKGGGGGTPFTLNILFQTKPERRLELVADAAPAPEVAPRLGMSSAEDDEFDEEV
jgi:hypothetical protein